MRLYKKRVVRAILSLLMTISLLPVYNFEMVQAAGTDGGVSVEEPKFSKDSGNYKEGFGLTLTVPDQTTVYYSTDGSDPKPGSESAYVHEYAAGTTIDVNDRTGEPNVLATEENADLMNQEGNHFYQPTADQVAKATVIRAMAVDAQGNQSPIVTKTYFVGNNLTTRHAGVPVISLVTDPDNLLSADKGIFVVGDHENYNQHGKEWERLTDMTYFNDKGEIDLSSFVGIRVRGGYTRKYQQKSLNIYFREEYGIKNWKYELIPGAMNHDGTAKTNKYKNFILRNGGNDANMTKMTDVFLQSLVRDRNISTQGYQPCVLYLNGEYWGMYNIMEKYSDNWLEEEFGVDKNNVVLIKDGEVEEGTDEDLALFDDLKKLAELDMTKDENYQKFLDAVDLTSYMDYYATEVILGNHDWGLEKNNQFWRSRTKTDSKYEDGKWRWLLHDTEFSMGLWGDDPDLIKNMQGSLDPEKLDPIFAAVSKNKEFRQAFASTVLDLLQNNLNYTKHVAKYDELTNFYRPLVMESLLRFGSDWNKGSEASCFDNRVKGFKEQWSKKENIILNQLQSNFGYKKSERSVVKFTSDCQDALHIMVNKVNKPTSGEKATATYYTKDPVTIEAQKVEGYNFAGWEVTGATVADASAEKTEMTLSESTVTLKAKYIALDSGNKTEKVPNKTVNVSANNEKPKTPVLVTKVTAPKRAVIAAVKSNKKRTMKIKIKKQSNIAGYEFLYARNKGFTKGKKKKFTNKTTVTIKKLKRKKTYFVKVRAYRKSGTKKVFGKYSKVKKVKIK